MDLAGKRVTVMGLGRFGGGVGVARYLVRQGADVRVTDLLDPDQLKDSLAQLDGLPIEYRLGEHNVSDFTTCDLVVANPAVKPDNRFLRAANAAGIPVTSEIRLLVSALPSRLRTIGVTGTAGKSTTTAMIGHILNKLYPMPPALPGDPSTDTTPRVWVGGNLGGSLLDHVEDIGHDDWVVLELSSFMLHGLRESEHFPGWSPHIAVVTNISPNHLDWHGSFEAYVADKQVILDDQDAECDAAVFGPGLHNELEYKVRDMRFREERDVQANPAIDLLLPGFHNQLNATLACDAVERAGAAWIDAAASLADFPGLPHRLQFVLEHNGVRYFNDSKCTTPEAAQLAIESFDPGTAHIILGGYDKGSDLKPLASLAAERCAGVYTIGDTGGGIQTAAEAASAKAEIVPCGELEIAVREAVKRAKHGHVVLLSPACASWDQFDNYERRGERFIELVKELTA
jgi:UDP-N-acetylmuramoylalanine--D-glutamate ligase